MRLSVPYMIGPIFCRARRSQVDPSRKPQQPIGLSARTPPVTRQRRRGMRLRPSARRPVGPAAFATAAGATTKGCGEALARPAPARRRS